MKKKYSLTSSTRAKSWLYLLVYLIVKFSFPLLLCGYLHVETGTIAEAQTDTASQTQQTAQGAKKQGVLVKIMDLKAYQLKSFVLVFMIFSLDNETRQGSLLFLVTLIENGYIRQNWKLLNFPLLRNFWPNNRPIVERPKTCCLLFHPRFLKVPLLQP